MGRGRKQPHGRYRKNMKHCDEYIEVDLTPIEEEALAKLYVKMIQGCDEDLPAAMKVQVVADMFTYIGRTYINLMINEKKQ